MKPIAELLSHFNARFTDSEKFEVSARAKASLEKLENMAALGMAGSFGFTDQGPHEIFSNYQREWLEHYGRLELLKDDPIAVYGLTNVGYSSWAFLEENAHLFGCSTRVFEEARKFGMSYGTAFALTVGQYRTVASVCHRPNVNEYFCREIYSILFNLTLDIRPDVIEKVNIEGLTQGENDVLRMMAQDYRDQEIADLLSIAIQTVRLRRRKAMKKLGARTISGVVAKAKSVGYI